MSSLTPEPRFKLASFEGPLDLLLHLIDRAKIDLQEIFVSEVTGQYLAYMEEAHELELDRATEFLSMAATLLYIKSRSLLPEPKTEEEDEWEDPEEQLIERLRAYRIFKEVAVSMGDLEINAPAVYYKLPEELLDFDDEVELEELNIDALAAAFRDFAAKRAQQKGKPRTITIKKDTYSIRAQKNKIVGLLDEKRRLPFTSLFEAHSDKAEIAVSFIALLELWAAGFLRAVQKYAFGEIWIEKRAEDIANG